MKPTIKDIANVANVSPATVSNALNNRRGVSDHIKRLVFKVAKDLGYTKEVAAERSTIRFVVYKRHGFVVSESPFFSSLIEGIGKQCRVQGYELLISHVNIHDIDYKEVMNSINSDNSAGIILLATEMLEEDLEMFHHFRIPMILLDSYLRSNIIDSVLINNTDAAYKATRYLIDNGHKDIGYLHSSFYINNFHFRKQGYLDAMNEKHLNVDEKYQINLEPTIDGAYKDMKNFLENGNAVFPTAFFADNDIIAFGAIKALQEKGVKIPEDISVVGFDDMPFCETTTPRMTTIKVFKQEMGSIAVKRLVEKIEGVDNVVQKIEVGTQLIVRDSHRPIVQHYL